MNENSKREDIIIEVGQEYIRVGLVGDRVPRKAIKASPYFHDPRLFGTPHFEMLLEELLYNIFFSYINCSSQGKTVVLLEKVFTDRRIIESMASIMFRKLKVEKIEMALSCVTPLYLTGKYSGLVVSAGASAVEIMPIYEGYPLFQNYKCLSVGTQRLNSMIRDQLALLNRDVSLDQIKQITDDEIADQIRYPYSSVAAPNKEITIAIRSKLRVKWVPDRVSYSIFFGEPQAEEPNLAQAFLSVLAGLPVPCFEAVCRNVVLAGGFWRVKGIQKLFKQQVVGLLGQFPRLASLEAGSKLGFVSWSFNPSQVSWIGCSIGASIRSVEHLSLRRTEFLEEGFKEKIMQAYFLSS